ncbi:hypothetical protein CTI12_AA100880 [Artemisia annua]|uniref:Uncharacterized protein n=1 Tax=Artemisia annua TaxID=35608 RepID=A0A2U1PXE7_ARTAN|nr:hypothetical protein CTI12_AA100880 [Artemisia annua]
MDIYYEAGFKFQNNRKEALWLTTAVILIATSVFIPMVVCSSTCTTLTSERLARLLFPYLGSICTTLTSERLALLLFPYLGLSSDGKLTFFCSDSKGLLRGILSDRDITRRFVACELHIENTPVSAVMTKNPVFVTSDTHDVEAWQKVVPGKSDTCLLSKMKMVWLFLTYNFFIRCNCTNGESYCVEGSWNH